METDAWEIALCLTNGRMASLHELTTRLFLKGTVANRLPLLQLQSTTSHGGTAVTSVEGRKKHKARTCDRVRVNKTYPLPINCHPEFATSPKWELIRQVMNAVRMLLHNSDNGLQLPGPSFRHLAESCKIFCLSVGEWSSEGFSVHLGRWYTLALQSMACSLPPLSTQVVLGEMGKVKKKDIKSQYKEGSFVRFKCRAVFFWQAGDNLSEQPLRLLENSLRKTNGGRAGRWSSVRADRRDSALSGYWHFHTQRRSARCITIPLQLIANKLNHSSRRLFFFFQRGRETFWYCKVPAWTSEIAISWAEFCSRLTDWNEFCHK